MAIVSLAEAKNQLRLTDSSDDTHVNLLIAAAEKKIVNFLNQEIPDNGDSPATYPEDIKCAALLIIGGLYEIREDMIVGASIEKNPAVVDLLYPYRVEIGI